MEWAELQAVQAALGALEAVLGHQVVAIAGRWRAERGVNFGEHAAWVARQVVEGGGGAPVTLALYAKGGDVHFAHGMCAQLGQVTLEQAMLLGPVDGAHAILPWLAASIGLLPGATLGAPEAGVLGQAKGEWSAHVVAHAPLEVWQMEDPMRRQVLQIAGQIHQAKALGHLNHRVLGARFGPALASTLAACLSQGYLERGFGLGAGELQALGIEGVSVPQGRELELWRELRDACERELGLHEFAHAPRYVEVAQRPGEVEFEMTRSEVGALIATAAGGYVFEVNTGDPDADTGLLRGHWRAIEVR